jgi:hypothetical protein
LVLLDIFKRRSFVPTVLPNLNTGTSVNRAFKCAQGFLVAALGIVGANEGH